MAEKINVALVSLGCDKNLTDSENLLGYIRAGGFGITADKTEADVIIVNTCGFIKRAADESENMLKECAALKSEGRLKAVIAVGCLAARYAKANHAALAFADRVALFGEYFHIGDIICEALNLSAESGAFGGRVVSTGYYAYMKIAEWCDNRCSYCAIPYIRGVYISRDFGELVAEAEALASGGVKELIIVAQDTSLYGEDLYGANRLPELLRAFTGIDGIEFVRLMYCYPERISDALIEEMAGNEKICDYIDIPIQHASDKILRAMGRKSAKAGIIDTIERLRAAMPDITIRTTLMVGFPGETEEDFTELLAFCAAVKFDRVGAFMYSREENTPAYDFSEQVPENVKKRRYKRIMEETARFSKKRRARFAGKVVKAVINGETTARGEHDAPDVDGKIAVERRHGEWTLGESVFVKITGVTKYDLTGVIVDEP